MTPGHDQGVGAAGGVHLPDLLRRHRLAAGLTQAELATRAGVGVRTVRDLERGHSSRPQRTTVELLVGALALTGPARTAFMAVARGAAAGPERVAPAAGSDGPPALPAGPVLVGRDREVAELVQLLIDPYGPRLVGLVGLAGVGKTALALTVAHAVATRYPAGAAGVPVGAGADADDVLAAVAAAFGADHVDDLATRLAGRPAVLLLDGAHGAPEGVAEALFRLPSLVPQIRLLVTGRQPVGVPGERVRPVAPLGVPPPEADGEGAVALAAYPAVALFTTRLAQVRREPPTPAELPALAALARRLGGLPLAIELMAARTRILDLTELLARYGDRVLDLAGPAQRTGWPPPGQAAAGRDATGPAVVTLREALADSYRLLTPPEREALRRLAAFHHRWSVDLAEELLADEADADGTVTVDPVPVLDRLHDLGLLDVSASGPFRFRLVGLVRAFAAEQADQAGEARAIRRRHAQVVARLVGRTAPDLVGPGLPGAARRLDEVAADIASALEHAAADEPETALLLAAGLSGWWRFRGREAAGRQWLCRLLADPRTADVDPVLRAWALLGAAELTAGRRAGVEEVAHARTALAAFRVAGDVGGELAARTVLCSLLIATGAHDEAREQAEKVLVLAARTGRIRDMAVAQNNLTWHDIRVGDLSGARRRLAAAGRLAAQCADQRLRLLTRANLAEVARLEGRYADAVEQGRQVAAALADLGDPGYHRRVLGTVGLALAQDGRAAEATDVLRELRTRAGPSGSPSAGRADPVGSTGPPEDGVGALVEGTIALLRGDRDLAAEWFAVAADAGGDGQDRRDVVEALVGLAASTTDVGVLDRLDQVCQESGIRLLPHEEGLLYALTVTRYVGPHRSRVTSSGGWRERYAP
ncbi:ATP-binding protein [Micromonospora fluostatini]|uniref:ATP-binding protein n=1 Tax=Micromonospora sp. JCM 30529 TaxID=3421643 RepID=UPI003D1726AB